MKNIKTFVAFVALVLAVLLLGSNVALADGDQPWHFTGQVGIDNLDSDRNTKNSELWWGVGFGRFLGNHLSVDIEYDETGAKYTDFDTVVPGATYDDWRLSTIGVMGRYHFGNGAWKPFVMAGLGSQSHRNVVDEGSNTVFSLGFGLAAQVAKHFSVRGQVMWRQDNDAHSQPPTNSYNDWYYSFGMSYDFGGKTPPPPPPPPPAAAPPPPPPNPDLDGDGVPNERDKCPNTRPGAVVDMDGCEVEAVISLEGVHFDFDKATLRPEAKVILDNAAALLQSQERVVVEVAGHTDSVGTEAYNQGLSERRANSVKDYLTSKGVKASRLTARGYGEVQPVASNDTDAGRQANRRVELIVLDR